jgi:hypothetical protein
LQIIGYLQADTVEAYKRGAVEKLFDISASQAKELMTVAGAKAGQELTVSRANLLFYLRNSREGQDAVTEMERRKKLAKRIHAAEEDLKLRNSVKLRVTREDEWSRYSDLPNVSIRPGLMQVAFTPGDPVDLLDTMYRWIKAVGNDHEQKEFKKMCAPASPPETPAGSATPRAPSPEPATAAEEETLFRLVKAVGNEWDAFTRMCSPAGPPAAETAAVRRSTPATCPCSCKLA